MAVCTNHLALRNHVQHGLPAAVAETPGDVELLVPEMVELEDERVGLAAVDAWSLAQERNEGGHALGNQRAFSS